ncbi:MAG: glycosyltransferase family 39 protein, partial [Abitibacteriaceae bacterium]|nr:glycosyltransferase family 39 protein [Abditibacteriaceae bacterium]
MKNKSAIAVTTIVLVAVTVRFVWLLLVVNRQWSDVQYYDEAACHLAHHLELRYIDPTIPALHYRAWFPPGWPFFLAFFHFLFGDSPWIVKIVNLVLSALIVWLIIQIGTRIFSQRVGLIGGLLWALLPGQIVYVSLSQYEVFLTALIVGIVYLLVMDDWATVTWQSPRLHVLGVALAWATMTRPLLVFFPLALAPYLIQMSGRRRGWLWTGILSVYIGVACLGWGLRNIAVLGEPVIFSTNGGYNLWHGNNPNATGGAFS